MRKIEKEMLRAIAEHRNWRKSNTRVNIVNDWAEVWLHGNKIAQIDLKNGDIYANHCGWATRTTLSRYKALGIIVRQKSKRWWIEWTDGQMCCRVWSSSIGYTGDVYCFLHFNKDGYLIETTNAYPEMLTDEQIMEQARLTAIEKKKNGAKARLKRQFRQIKRDTTWWSNPHFF